MKMKLMLTLVLCLSVFTTAFAQKGKGKGEMKDRTAEERATAHTNHLEKKLALTADQKTQVYAINLEAAQKNDALREKSKAAGKDKDAKKAIQAERKENHEARKSKIEGLLTDAQKTKWEVWKAAEKKRVELRKAAKGKAKSGTGEDLEDDND